MDYPTQITPVPSRRKALRDLQLITLAPAVEPDHPPMITLLREDMSGRPYLAPTDRDGDYYFRMPEALWLLGGLAELPGAAVTMAVMAHRIRDRRNDEVWFGRKRFTERYAISDSTRKKGLDGLVDHRVLRRRVDSTDIAGDTTHRRRRRAVYTTFSKDFDHPQLAPSLAPPMFS